ncbi:MAG: helical backbone metal receptor [Promethearchaeota archaeon]
MKKSPKNPQRLKGLRRNKIIPIIVACGLVVSAIPIGIFMLTTQKSTIPDGYIFKDSLDREVMVPYNPKRIISLSPSVTELLYELEVDDRLVGVTSYCNYPNEALDKTDVGGFTTPNMEVILELNPDLIISSYSAWSEEEISAFEDLSLTLVIIFASTLDEIIEQISIIGDLTKAGSKSIELKNKLLQDMKYITDKTSKIDQSDKLDCYFEVWESPMVAGSKSYIDDMIQKAGAINIFHSIEYEYHTVSHESVILSDPDVIFITEHSAPWYSQEVSDRPGYNVISACVNNRIYRCFDDIYLRTGPRIMIALENMTRYLYPSLFIEDGQPLAEFTVNQTTILEGESIEFLFTGTEGDAPATFYWDFGDGQNSTEQDPIHAYAIIGTYEVTLTIEDSNGDSDEKSIIIKVEKNLLPTAQFIVDDRIIIEGEIIEFLFTGLEGNGPATFYWDFGDGQHSTEQNPTHLYENVGIYDVSLTVEDSNGDSDISSAFYVLVLWNCSFWDYIISWINQL